MRLFPNLRRRGFDLVGALKRSNSGRRPRGRRDACYPTAIPAITQTLQQRILPTAVWVASTQNGTEGGQNGSITLQRDSMSGTLDVNYGVDLTNSTAQRGIDYAMLSNTATFADGQRMVTIAVNVIDDSQVEPTETLIVNLSASTNGSYTLANPSTATIQIFDNDTPQNSPPVIMPRNTSFTVAQGQTLAPGAMTVMGGDPDGDPITLQLVSNVSHGSLTLNQNSTFSYTPNSTYVGQDSFQVRYVDNKGAASNVVTVSINVTGNNPPVITANQTTYTMSHDHTLYAIRPAVFGSDPDGGPVTLQLVSNVANGSLTLNQDGTFSYTPAWRYVGQDAFQVRYVDSLGAASSTVSILISVTNMSPSFGSSSATVTVNENTPIGTTISTNGASDPDDQSLTYAITSGNGAGYFSIDANGQLKVAANLDYEAMTQHQFTLVLQAADPLGATAMKTVTINVADVNEPPVLQNFNVSTTDGSVYTFTGHVVDDGTSSNCYVVFGGLLAGQQFSCDSSGNFSYTVTLGGGASGLVYGTAYDSLGQSSATSFVVI